MVGVRPTLPLSGVEFILGNDLARSKVDLQPELQVIDDPEELEPQGFSVAVKSTIFPSCVVTRAAAQRARDSKEKAKELSDFNSSNNSSSCSVDATILVGDGNGGTNSDKISKNHTKFSTIKSSTDS